LENARPFKGKIQQGQVCIGTNVTLSDHSVAEALCQVLDFLWIDMEHNPLSLKDVEGHIIATKGSDTAPLVRVPANDPNLIKQVLDIGAAGVIVPMIKSAEDVRLAVAACRYPPDGIRGYGPRRPSRYGASGGPSYCQVANQSVLCFVQIEHRDAVADLDAILAVHGLDGVVVGPMDLSGALGHMAEPGHPVVTAAIQDTLGRARQAGVMAGIAIGNDPAQARHWIDCGAQWVSLGCDYTFMLETAQRIRQQVLALTE
jgi:4-hydroxy-2-oxoheptanedioate aldolase